MPKWRERECTVCKSKLLTASKSEVCIACFAKNKTLNVVEREKQIIKDYGYKIVGEPEVNKFGKRVYTLISVCCESQFKTVYGNLISGINRNEKSGYNKLPCGVCGPKHRMANALAGYVAKNGVNYDEATYKQYKKQVYNASHVVYEQHTSQLNPNGYKRGLAGKEGAYHLDHIVPVITCFKEGWTVEQASAVENLQLLKWDDNLSKGSKLSD